MAVATMTTSVFNHTSFNDTVDDIYDMPPRPRGRPPMMPPYHDFKKYAYPVTIAFGILGNVLIVYIFTRTKLKKPSTARYLAATAVTDCGFLLINLFTAIDSYYGVAIQSNVGACQLIMFGNYVFVFLSTWYLTAVMVEKYVGVSWPRIKSQMCTVFRAKCVIVSLAIVSLVCYLYITWFFGVMVTPFGPKCSLFYREKGIVEAWQVLTKMDAVINFAIPYIVIFITSCLIARRTWEYRKSSRSAGERFLRRQRVTTPADKEFKTTPLLLLLAVCTLLLCTPNNSSSLRRVFATEPFVPTVTDLKVIAVFHYMATLNYSVKVLVYVFSSPAFAKEIWKLVYSVKSLLHINREPTNELAKLSDDRNTKTVATSTEGIV